MARITHQFPADDDPIFDNDVVIGSPLRGRASSNPQQEPPLTPIPDPKAAAIHRKRAEDAYKDAEHFRKLGRKSAETQALAAAHWESRLADLLEHPERER